jgi:hypothetical protein
MCTDDRRTAHHEAGHAVVAILLGIEIEQVYLRGSYEGGACIPVDDQDKDILRDAIFGCAGICAQQRFDQLYARFQKRPPLDPDWESDAKTIWRNLAIVLHKFKPPEGTTGETKISTNDFPPEVHADFDVCMTRADAMVKEHWGIIHDVAKELYRRKTMTGAEVKAIMGLQPNSRAADAGPTAPCTHGEILRSIEREEIRP